MDADSKDIVGATTRAACEGEQYGICLRAIKEVGYVQSMKG